MTTATWLPSAGMPSREIDLKTRQRIAANMRKIKHKLEFASDSAMAQKAKISRGVINRILKGERTVGLDVLLKIHRNLHVSIDLLVDSDPEPHWFDPDYDPKR